MSSNLSGVEWIDIRSVPTEYSGNLQFFEALHDFEFEIKRIYYITDVPKGTWRGAHAHKRLKQMLFCPYGSVTLKLSDGCNTVDFTLDRPDKGLIIWKPIWRDMYWNVENSVLCVAASDYYDENDYIREFMEYKSFLNEKRFSRLRRLEKKDAIRMLEWMGDNEVTKYLRNDFSNKNMQDVEKFIENSTNKENINMAIVDSEDNYMGTVSLKNIDYENREAEMAIVIRKDAMSKGYSTYAINEIIRIAFEEYKLKKVYWCVNKKNQRAIKFYNKNGFSTTGSISDKVLSNYKDVEGLLWYEIKNREV